MFHNGGHANPAVLQANARASFAGYKIYGQGFTFDDTDDVASPLAEMRRLITKDRKNAERIFPYIGGEEVNESPTHSFHRYAIDFFDMSLEEASNWPDLLEIVRSRVKPERDILKREALCRYWWHYGEKRPGMRAAIHGLQRVLVCSLVSHHLSFAFLPGEMVYSHKLAVFPSMSNAFFAVVQSRLHEVWARFFSSSLEDRLNYTPSDCFETFPFPENFGTNAKLEAMGKEYYEFRAALMVKNNEGLTKTYNRFHDPNETSAEIKKLRELHAAMDRAVLTAYGWTDLQPTCEFLLDYDEEEEDEEDATGASRPSARRKKKPWRYRWPDDFRDLVLARLLELNKQRAEQEKLSGAAAEEKPKKAGKKGGRKKSGGEKESPGLY